jgi:O-acetyl-ADP-ribose deacetylase (regulator of RNase III)
MIEIITADITTLQVDAIVNAANGMLRGGGGVDGAIHRAAGPELLEDLKQYPGCATGDAVLTRGYALPAKYVIHAVGPVWHGGSRGEAELLAKTYDRAFAVALEAGDIRTIAFPAISTGVFSFPKPKAARIALAEMVRREKSFERVVACLFDDESAALYRDVLRAIRPSP